MSEGNIPVKHEMRRTHIPLTPNSFGIYGNIPAGYALAVTPLAKNIRRWRLAAEMTQIDLSVAVGIGQSAVSKWESGESDPAAEMLPKLAAVLCCSLDDLMKGIDKSYDSNPRQGSSDTKTVIDVSERKQPNKGEPMTSSVSPDDVQMKALVRKTYESVHPGGVDVVAVAVRSPLIVATDLLDHADTLRREADALTSIAHRLTDDAAAETRGGVDVAPKRASGTGPLRQRSAGRGPKR